MMNTRDETLFLQAIGRDVRNRRENEGWDLKLFAQKTTLTAGHLKNIENGDASPRLTDLLRISKAFKINMSELFSGN